MRIDKQQKKILVTLLLLCLITPVGILLPMFFNAGNAWGEWSAQTLKDIIGYVPQGLAKYSDVWKAPIADYSINSGDRSVIHQSGFYLVSGIVGATITYVVMLFISRLITKKDE